MTQISKKPLFARREKELLSSLDLVLSSITKKEDMNEFLNALMTKTERLMFSKRLASVYLLSKGIPQANIGLSLNMTSITISKILYFFESRGNKGYKIALWKIEREANLNLAKRALASLARYSIRAAGGQVKSNVFD